MQCNVMQCNVMQCNVMYVRMYIYIRIIVLYMYMYKCVIYIYCRCFLFYIELYQVISCIYIYIYICKTTFAYPIIVWKPWSFKKADPLPRLIHSVLELSNCFACNMTQHATPSSWLAQLLLNCHESWGKRQLSQQGYKQSHPNPTNLCVYTYMYIYTLTQPAPFIST